jgi:hypothetical protein
MRCNGNLVYANPRERSAHETNNDNDPKSDTGISDNGNSNSGNGRDDDLNDGDNSYSFLNDEAEGLVQHGEHIGVPMLPPLNATVEVRSMRDAIGERDVAGHYTWNETHEMNATSVPDSLSQLPMSIGNNGQMMAEVPVSPLIARNRIAKNVEPFAEQTSERRPV